MNSIFSDSLNDNRISFVVLILVASLILFVQYSPILTAQSHEVIQGSGDAFNAYKLVTYHAKYDSTYTYFGGNGYPYQEHVVIASALPLLSNSLQFLRKIGLDFTDYCIPTIHYSIIFSYLLCAIFLYLLFRKLALPAWYSIIIAIAVTLLSPQNDRIFAHFGLAHAFPLPMTIYFLLLFHNKPRWTVSFCLLLTVLLSSLIQFYFFALTAFLIGGFYFFLILKRFRFKWNNSSKWNFLFKDISFYGSHAFIQVVLPFLFFQYWLSCFPISDRPDQPDGYLNYTSSWEALFFSNRLPYYKWIHQYIIPIKNIDLNNNFEGLAYIGTATTIIMIIILIRWIGAFINNTHTKTVLSIHQKKFLQVLFLAAVVLLLFSFGLPFSIPKLEFLLAYTGPIQQFRSVGRFSWIFYYTINIVAFTYLYHCFWLLKHSTQISNFTKTKLITLVLLSLLIYETWQLSNSRTHSVCAIKELEKPHYFQKHFNLDFSDYQAILPLPFFHVGTDNFSAKVSPFIQQKSLLLTMESGLPSIASLSNRSSISRTFKLLQAASEPYQIPSILEDLPNKKPFLIIAEINSLAKYKSLIDSLKLIQESERLLFYEMPIEVYAKKVALRQLEIKNKINSNSLKQLPDFYSTDSLQNYIYKNYDRAQIRRKYQGDGSLKLKIDKEQVILKTQIPNPKKNTEYTLSFWSYQNQFPAAITFVYIKEYDPLTGKLLWKHFPQIRNFMPVMDNNGWALFEFSFKIQKQGLLEISLFNNGMKNKYFYMDELLIRKSTTDLYQSNNSLFKNNRWYKLKN